MSKRKGAKAEREARDLLTEITGMEWDRRLIEGRSDDTGDLICLDDDRYCVQVKSYANPLAGFSSARQGLTRQACMLSRQHREPVMGFALIKNPQKGWLMAYEAWDTRVANARIGQWTRPMLDVAVQGITLCKGSWLVTTPGIGWEQLHNGQWSHESRPWYQP